MASTISLGLRTPSALPYLIQEGILPAEPAANLYSWETYSDGDTEDELLTTDYTVVWSRAGVIKKSFHFKHEQQKVIQALLTTFPAEKQSPEGLSSTPRDKKSTACSRALAVILRSQVHVFFLSGASHIVNLPFAIEKAFRAPRGLLLHRQSEYPAKGDVSQSFLSVPEATAVSPLLSRSNLSHQVDTSRTSNHATLSDPSLAFWEKLHRATKPLKDDLPAYFTLTNPLSVMGLAFTCQRVAGKDQDGTTCFLGGDEHVLYVSDGDDVPSHITHGDYFFIITFNLRKQRYYVWLACYVQFCSVSESSKQRDADLKASRTRRRSSYGPALTNGATTPSVRPRDVVREPWAGVTGSVHPTAQGIGGSQASLPVSANAEDILASQVDPEFQTSQSVRESRRVSSIIARGADNAIHERYGPQELTRSFVSLTSSVKPTLRRGQSFGGHVEQNPGASGRSKTRASTPLPRLSVTGAEEPHTAANVALSTDQAGTPVEGITKEGATVSVMRNPDIQEDLCRFPRELRLVKVDSIPIPTTEERQSLQVSTDLPSCRAFVTQGCTLLAGEQGCTRTDVEVHIINYDLKEVLQVTYNLQAGASQHHQAGAGARYHYSGLRVSRTSLQHHGNCLDLVVLGRPKEKRVLRLETAGNGLRLLTGWEGITLPVTLNRQPRVFTSMTITPISSPRRAETGLRRTVTGVLDLVSLSNGTEEGCFEVIDQEGRAHKHQICIQTDNLYVRNIMDVCDHVLPPCMAEQVSSMFWMVKHDLRGHVRIAGEWPALTIALFAIYKNALHHHPVRNRSRKGQSPTKPFSRGSVGLHTRKDYWKDVQCSQRVHQVLGTLASPAWSWVGRQSHDVSVSEQPIFSASVSRRSTFLTECIQVAEHYAKNLGSSLKSCILHLTDPSLTLGRLLVGLHLLSEEQKLQLNGRTNGEVGSRLYDMTPILAQLGFWLGWEEWSWKDGSYYELEGATTELWEFDQTRPVKSEFSQYSSAGQPPSIFSWFAKSLGLESPGAFPRMSWVCSGSNNQRTEDPDGIDARFTPRTVALLTYVSKIQVEQRPLVPREKVELIAKLAIDDRMLATLPEALIALVKDAIIEMQVHPPTTWDLRLLDLIGREDLTLFHGRNRLSHPDLQSLLFFGPASVLRDVHSICNSSEGSIILQSAPEADRLAVTRLLFSGDRRFLEAAKLLEPLRMATAECKPEPEWTEAQHLEKQKEVMQYVMTRYFALPPGHAMLLFDSRKPLLTEKYYLHGFQTLCIMKPLNNTISADRSTFTEEKYSWAFFHAGVSAGLSISRNAQGIDTSWIVFNKPADLNNRHAGLLLALGLNGHLRSLAKWLAFKYLTPKHTMTSVGLLLGLSISYIGTMDTLVTRLLSVHVTRMLPPGAAELNLSPLIQTTGLMGIGILYHNTQHRRMSEIMLSEIEHISATDESGSPDPLRDEGYRLAAGFALGLINLGNGKDLRGMRDMRIIERLLQVAVGHRPIETVHEVDQATAGAIIAIGFICMKSQNEALARRIDCPDTVAQFGYVRTDMFLLRTLAGNLIMWDNIEASSDWIQGKLPERYRHCADLRNVQKLKDDDMPFYNILAGLLWSVSLKHSGTGDVSVRDLLIYFLDQFMRLGAYYAHTYAERQTRNTIRKCQDLLCLAVATVMAGTGDIVIFRRLRVLHQRTNKDTTYGSHLATHMALGVLFLGAGSYTFGTSNLAIAALICAFYPLYPRDVLDNKAHLQAFRHLWVLAAEARCLVIKDVDTHRTISAPIIVQTTDLDEKTMVAPCLLPELDRIAFVKTSSPEHWQVTLDFANNPAHRRAFQNDPTIYVRRCAARDANPTTFGATLVALNDAHALNTGRMLWQWIFRLRALADLNGPDIGLALPPDPSSSMHASTSGTVLDDRLTLRRAADVLVPDGLWSLKCLFHWVENAALDNDSASWLGKGFIDGLRSMVQERMRLYEQPIHQTD